MKYKIIHHESDCEWVEENPKQEDLDRWFNQGCTILEMEDKNERC